MAPVCLNDVLDTLKKN